MLTSIRRSGIVETIEWKHLRSNSNKNESISTVNARCKIDNRILNNPPLTSLEVKLSSQHKPLKY